VPARFTPHSPSSIRPRRPTRRRARASRCGRWCSTAERRHTGSSCPADVAMISLRCASLQEARGGRRPVPAASAVALQQRVGELDHAGVGHVLAQLQQFRNAACSWRACCTSGSPRGGRAERRRGNAPAVAAGRGMHALAEFHTWRCGGRQASKPGYSSRYRRKRISSVDPEKSSSAGGRGSWLSMIDSSG